ncbi:MAG TPA: uridine diphosphate-N-acetylglucosamine-binding protein YvcK [Actinomycetes bacterium]|nr:uridine diphosphate-N-acetylglucosamine-binding protein YvcK [Actinomycetes bacterium]
MSEPAPAVVALGGGHGLAVTLTALRRVTRELTAVVTVADDGGSSGRLRRELGVLPPGDLRMALAALCGDDEWGRTWRDVLQHRFAGEGELAGHAVGNLLIVALWDRLRDPVAGLDWVGRLLGAQGRVLPMAAVPLDIEAEVLGGDPERPGDQVTVRGQVAVATTPGRVVTLSLVPPEPPACPEAVAAVRAADVVVLGPGSWFTSVIPHLLVPQLRDALVTTPARRVLVLNLRPQPGETSGFSAENHLEVLLAHAPELRLDVVVADRAEVPDPKGLGELCAALGAELVVADVAADDGSARHDPERLASVFGTVVGRGRIGAWR